MEQEILNDIAENLFPPIGKFGVKDIFIKHEKSECFDRYLVKISILTHNVKIDELVYNIKALKQYVKKYFKISFDKIKNSQDSSFLSELIFSIHAKDFKNSVLVQSHQTINRYSL